MVLDESLRLVNVARRASLLGAAGVARAWEVQVLTWASGLAILIIKSEVARAWEVQVQESLMGQARPQEDRQQ